MDTRSITVTLLLLSCGVSLAAEPPRRPNILLFLTDDESALERSAYGWSNLPTPHFDRVEKEGVLFTNAFTSSPSCAPSRASILTGRNFWELKQGAFIQAYIPKEYPVFTRILEDNGYQLGYTGKQRGPGSHADGIPGDSLGRKYQRIEVPNPPACVRATDYAANFQQFLADRDSEKPFFFWAGVTEPHEPSCEENTTLLEEQFGMPLDAVQLPPFAEDTPPKRRRRGGFLYEICYADTHLGRMLEILEANGELANTIVIVTSDNGTAMLVDGEHRGKASPYDYGVHEPLAIMWPAAVPAGRTVTDFINFADFAPTLLEAAGIDPPSSMTGRSFLLQLTTTASGRIDNSRDFIVTGLEWHGEFDPVSRSSRTIRNDRYAYIRRYDNVNADGELLDDEAAVRPARVEFYDLQNDMWQQNNLADDPAFASDREQLAKQLDEVGRRTGDPRVTGDMALFQKTRQYVQKRKRMGYANAKNIPFE